MPEPVNGGSSLKPPKEMSMEVRLLLAFLLMGAVMFLSQFFFKSQTPPPKKADQAKSAQVDQSAPVPAAPAQSPPVDAAATAAPAVPPTSSQAQPPFIIDTDLFRVALSNQGGNVRSWQLKKYKVADNKPLELVNTSSGLAAPFSLYFPGQKPATDVNWAWYTQTGDPDGLGVSYEFSDGHTVVRKTFRFERNSYISHVTSEVTIDGKPVPSSIQWRGGFGDLTVANPSGTQHVLFYDLAANKLVTKSVGDAKNGPAAFTGNFSFAGVADTYFAAVSLPQGSTQSQVTVFADTVRTTLEEKPQNFPGVAVADGASNNFELFVGPKDLDLLSKLNPKLTQVVDFGWLSVLAKPLFLLVNWFNDSFVHNFGWSIILVTIAINFILFPLKLSNMKSMRKMQALKPQIDAINEKYRGLKMTDPKKGEQNQEVMDLYKKYGVNPMGGCVPMLLQIPFFFAFYKVFTVSVEMRGAPWLWVHDLSQPEHLPIKILPIVMIASQFVMQKMTPQAGGDPNQQRMMMLMPLIFGVMFYNFPSGLVLYYLTSNLVGMGQQWFFNHTESAQEAARSVELPKKKNGRK
jgi:YidC/Oxa1 family membrane protein insertase